MAPAPDPGPEGQSSQKGPLQYETKFQEEMAVPRFTVDSKFEFGGVGWLIF